MSLSLSNRLREPWLEDLRLSGLADLLEGLLDLDETWRPGPSMTLLLLPLLTSAGGKRGVRGLAGESLRLRWLLRDGEDRLELPLQESPTAPTGSDAFPPFVGGLRRLRGEDRLELLLLHDPSTMEDPWSSKSEQSECSSPGAGVPAGPSARYFLARCLYLESHGWT